MDSHLPAAVAAFRNVYSRDPHFTPAHQAQLDALSSNATVCRNWERFFRCNETDCVLLLHRIFGIQSRAEMNGELVSMNEQARTLYADLMAAAEKLEGFFSNNVATLIAGENGETFQSAQQTNDGARNCRASMRWAKSYLAAAETKRNAFVFREFPASQKRDQPHLAFALQLCREMKERFDAVPWTLVTAITASFYPASGSVGLVESIKKAYPEEVRRRDREHLAAD